jgi:hypothetical protein
MTNQELFDSLCVGDKLIASSRLQDGWSYIVTIENKYKEEGTHRISGKFVVRTRPTNSTSMFMVGRDLGLCDIELVHYDWEFVQDCLDDVLMRVYKTGFYDLRKLKAYLTEAN